MSRTEVHKWPGFSSITSKRPRAQSPVSTSPNPDLKVLTTEIERKALFGRGEKDQPTKVTELLREVLRGKLAYS